MITKNKKRKTGATTRQQHTAESSRNDSPNADESLHAKPSVTEQRKANISVPFFSLLSFLFQMIGKSGYRNGERERHFVFALKRPRQNNVKKSKQINSDSCLCSKGESATSTTQQQSKTVACVSNATLETGREGRKKAPL